MLIMQTIREQKLVDVWIKNENDNWKSKHKSNLNVKRIMLSNVSKAKFSEVPKIILIQTPILIPPVFEFPIMTLSHKNRLHGSKLPLPTAVAAPPVTNGVSHHENLTPTQTRPGSQFFWIFSFKDGVGLGSLPIQFTKQQIRGRLYVWIRVYGLPVFQMLCLDPCHLLSSWPVSLHIKPTLEPTNLLVSNA